MATNNALNAPFPFSPGIGGTGVNNGSFTCTFGGNFSTSGPFSVPGGFSFVGNLEGNTNITFPQTGTLATVGQVFNQVDQNFTPFNINSNTVYCMDTGATLGVGTLPSTSKVGDIVKIVGFSAGGWKISQLAGQQILFGNVSTASGVTGSIQSTNPGDCVELICVVSNLTWRVSGPQGNIDYA